MCAIKCIFSNEVEVINFLDLLELKGSETLLIDFETNFYENGILYDESTQYIDNSFDAIISFDRSISKEKIVNYLKWLKSGGKCLIRTVTEDSVYYNLIKNAFEKVKVYSTTGPKFLPADYSKTVYSHKGRILHFEIINHWVVGDLIEVMGGAKNLIFPYIEKDALESFSQVFLESLSPYIKDNLVLIPSKTVICLFAKN